MARHSRVFRTGLRSDRANMRARTPTYLLSLAIFSLTSGGASLAAESPDVSQILDTAAILTADSDTAYVSDYFSFASLPGPDEIAFALDTNRGRKGDAYQAEHFVELYEAPRGWIDIPGYAKFENTGKVLTELPDSPFFSFDGQSYGPVTISAKDVPLRLEVGAIEPRFTRHDDRVLFSLGSAPATLEWQGRAVRGRVIYEYLVMRGSNRLAGLSISGILDALGHGPDFQGLYLATGDGQDLYIQLSESSAASALMDPLLAFETRADAAAAIRNLTFEILDYDLAFGFYRWPVRWQASWDASCGQATLQVGSQAHKTEKNWLIGGFAMQALSGTLSCEGRAVPVFGFGEVIR